jgi:hypothetical protein
VLRTMRTITVFYAWQSDTPERFNRHLIRVALDEAAKRISQDAAVAVQVRIDSDTEGVPGQPPVTDTILKKIEGCDVFAPDVTFVATTKGGKLIPNPNVMTELGYALRAKTHSAMMFIMNTSFGPPEKLPFDMGHVRHPIQYNVAPTAKDAERREVRNKLSADIEKILRLQIEATKPPSPPPPPFIEVQPKDGPARFRPAGIPVGRRWDKMPFVAGSEQEVLLSAGPAVWLRLMPTVNPGKAWPAHDLHDHAVQTGSLRLAPFVYHNLNVLRAEDGIAICPLLTPDAGDTTSVAFVFNTGEIWSIDCTMLVYNAAGNIPYLEKLLIDRLQDYALLLSSLGINPPYRWIAGVTGVKDRRLEIPPAPGHMVMAGWHGPRCLSDTIVKEGIYDGSHSPAASLSPIFNAIFDSCGVPRPDYLPR